jgi:hypothetical protein
VIHYSKFSLFAFLALICAAVSSCTSTSALSSDPQTAEDILRASTEHPAIVTLKNGNADTCFEVAVRKDTTIWRGLGEYVSMPTDSVSSINEKGTLVTLKNGSTISCYNAATKYCYKADNNVEIGKEITTWHRWKDVSVPTDSVASIKVANPQAGAIVLCVLAGGVLGGIIGNALFVPTPNPPADISAGAQHRDPKQGRPGSCSRVRCSAWRWNRSPCGCRN